MMTMKLSSQANISFNRTAVPLQRRCESVVPQQVRLAASFRYGRTYYCKECKEDVRVELRVTDLKLV